MTSYSPALRWYHKTAAVNTGLGLTTKGTTRKRRVNADLRKKEMARRRERGLRAWNLRVMRLREQGLNTRGKPRIIPVRRGDGLILNSQLEALAVAVGRIFDSLSPDAKVAALELERSLSAIKKQLA